MPAHVPNAGLTRRDLLKRTGSLAALAAFTAACGGNTGRPASSGDSGGGAKVNLAQWYHQYGEAGTQQAATRYAKAYTDANVAVQWTPGDYGAKLSSGLLSSKGPDVFESQLNIGMVKSNQIVPLDDIMADVKDDFLPGDLATNTVDGKIYGIRMIIDPQVIYYRKSLLDKAGIKPPETIDDLIAASKELTTNKVKGMFVGNDGGNAMGGPALVVGRLLPDRRQQARLHRRPRGPGVRQAARVVREQEHPARRADGLVGPGRDQPGPGRHAVDRHVGRARHAEGTG
jgi:multiple sugar transport system substrate-binding protein